VGRNAREKTRLEKKHKRVRTWAVAIIAVSIVVAGSVKALQQSSVGSADAGRVALGPPTVVVQQTTPAVVQQTTPAVVQQATPAVVQQTTPIVVQQTTPTVRQQATPIVVQQATPTTGPPLTPAGQVQRITVEDTKALLD